MCNLQIWKKNKNWNLKKNNDFASIFRNAGDQ